MGAARCLALAALTLITSLAVGCATGLRRSTETEVEFRAPSVPDPLLDPLMEGVESIGVLSTTNIEPLQGLDIEKVMGRLTDATARGLENRPDTRVVSQDEIRWHFRTVALDSATVFSDSLTAAMRADLEIDALVYVTLRSLNARMTPVSPSPYGTQSTPGLNLSVELQMLIVNLHSGARWSQEGRRNSWKPMQVDLASGNSRDPTERQLLAALAGPLRQFLGHVSPPPRQQVRIFDVSGE